MLVGIVCRQVTTSVVVLTLVLLLLLSFSGFLTAETKVYFVWLQKVGGQNNRALVGPHF